MSGLSLRGLNTALRREIRTVGVSHRRRRILLVIILVAVLVGRHAVT